MLDVSVYFHTLNIVCVNIYQITKNPVISNVEEYANEHSYLMEGGEFIGQLATITCSRTAESIEIIKLDNNFYILNYLTQIYKIVD
jgi:hypothetical protein